MKLTERQCWDILRLMVKSKNDEYSAFLLRFLDKEALRQILGITRDAFLNKSGFTSLEDFDQYIKSKGIQPVQKWLDNLSGEDLLLFLDFRCQILQELYRHYKMYRDIDKKTIQTIIANAKVSPLNAYNYGKLMCTGKPKRVSGEKRFYELSINDYKLQQMTLAQVMGNIATTYSLECNKPLGQAQEMASKLLTYNVDSTGNLTGCRFDGEISVCEPIRINNKPRPSIKRIEHEKESKFELIGFDESMTPVFKYEGQRVNFFKQPLPMVKLVYDANKQKIIDEFEL